MFCSKCGTKIPDDSLFCYKCGCKVVIPSQDDSGTSCDEEPEKTEGVAEEVSITEPAVDTKLDDDSKKETEVQVELKQEETPAQEMLVSETPTYYSQFPTYDREATNALLFTKEYWFTWRGRRNRQPTWIIGSIFTLINKGLEKGFLAAMATHNTSLIWILFVVSLFFAYLSTVNLGKRFHDLDMPGWYAAIFEVVTLAITFMFPQEAVFIVLIPSLYLTFAKGTDGENQYGPDRLKS